MKLVIEQTALGGQPCWEVTVSGLQPDGETTWSVRHCASARELQARRAYRGVPPVRAAADSAIFAFERMAEPQAHQAASLVRDLLEAE